MSGLSTFAFQSTLSNDPRSGGGFVGNGDVGGALPRDGKTEAISFRGVGADPRLVTSSRGASGGGAAGAGVVAYGFLPPLGDLRGIPHFAELFPTVEAILSRRGGGVTSGAYGSPPLSPQQRRLLEHAKQEAFAPIDRSNGLLGSEQRLLEALEQAMNHERDAMRLETEQRFLATYSLPPSERSKVVEEQSQKWKDVEVPLVMCLDHLRSLPPAVEIAGGKAHTRDSRALAAIDLLTSAAGREGRPVAPVTYRQLHTLLLEGLEAAGVSGVSPSSDASLEKLQLEADLEYARRYAEKESARERFETERRQQQADEQTKRELEAELIRVRAAADAASAVAGGGSVHGGSDPVASELSERLLQLRLKMATLEDEARLRHEKEKADAARHEIELTRLHTEDTLKIRRELEEDLAKTRSTAMLEEMQKRQESLAAEEGTKQRKEQLDNEARMLEAEWKKRQEDVDAADLKKNQTHEEKASKDPAKASSDVRPKKPNFLAAARHHKPGRPSSPRPSLGLKPSPKGIASPRTSTSDGSLLKPTRHREEVETVENRREDALQEQREQLEAEIRNQLEGVAAGSERRDEEARKLKEEHEAELLRLKQDADAQGKRAGLAGRLLGAGKARAQEEAIRRQQEEHEADILRQRDEARKQADENEAVRKQVEEQDALLKSLEGKQEDIRKQREDAEVLNARRAGELREQQEQREADILRHREEVERLENRREDALQEQREQLEAEIRNQLEGVAAGSERRDEEARKLKEEHEAELLRLKQDADAQGKRAGLAGRLLGAGKARAQEESIRRQQEEYEETFRKADLDHQEALERQRMENEAAVKQARDAADKLSEDSTAQRRELQAELERERAEAKKLGEERDRAIRELLKQNEAAREENERRRHEKSEGPLDEASRLQMDATRQNDYVLQALREKEQEQEAEGKRRQEEFAYTIFTQREEQEAERKRRQEEFEYTIFEQQKEQVAEGKRRQEEYEYSLFEQCAQRDAGERAAKEELAFALFRQQEENEAEKRNIQEEDARRLLDEELSQQAEKKRQHDEIEDQLEEIEKQRIEAERAQKLLDDEKDRWQAERDKLKEEMRNRQLLVAAKALEDRERLLKAAQEARVEAYRMLTKREAQDIVKVDAVRKLLLRYARTVVPRLQEDAARAVAKLRAGHMNSQKKVVGQEADPKLMSEFKGGIRDIQDYEQNMLMALRRIDPTAHGSELEMLTQTALDKATAGNEDVLKGDLKAIEVARQGTAQRLRQAEENLDALLGDDLAADFTARWAQQVLSVADDSRRVAVEKEAQALDLKRDKLANMDPPQVDLNAAASSRVPAAVASFTANSAAAPAIEVKAALAQADGQRLVPVKLRIPGLKKKQMGDQEQFRKAFADKMRATLDLDENQFRFIEKSGGTG
eukprot:TRINITY_DN19867_c0_g1_i1.p1 TRINITY_DN19867_c0_g1~~TRINITY_DN19867_c0_g1_i1.p1  ORF type:complete len:1402 (+),score=389.49 TRINITY_DN19867_c0_g1_i1:196-4401(+)